MFNFNNISSQFIILFMPEKVEDLQWKPSIQGGFNMTFVAQSSTILSHININYQADLQIYILSTIIYILQCLADIESPGIRYWLLSTDVWAETEHFWFLDSCSGSSLPAVHSLVCLQLLYNQRTSFSSKFSENKWADLQGGSHLVNCNFFSQKWQNSSVTL